MNANDNLPDVEGYDSEKEEDAMDFESDSDSSDSTSERSDYSCPFCHTDFINQVLKMIRPYYQQNFETDDGNEKHIMR